MGLSLRIYEKRSFLRWGALHLKIHGWSYVISAPEYVLSNSTLLNKILNKIPGPAARILATNGIPNNWIGIRQTLINSFSDHRDQCSLYTDLSSLTQGTDSSQIYYENVQNLLRTIMAYVKFHENVSTTVTSKRQLYNKLALQTYRRRLEEPVGSRIRCMRPNALEYTQE